MMSVDFLVITEIDGKKLVLYSDYIDLQSEYVRETEKQKSEIKELQKKVEELEKQNTDIRECHMKLQNDSADEIRELKTEIEKLKKICREKQYTITDKSEQINELYKKYEPMEDSIEHFGIKFSTIDGIPMFSFKLRGEEVNPAIIIAENDELKAEIQRLSEKCGEVPIDTDKTCVSDCGPDYELLCRKLQDQHQQDCITINQLHVTIDKLVDRYANLRKNVGMD